jgi:hypothetical protein
MSIRYFRAYQKKVALRDAEPPIIAAHLRTADADSSLSHGNMDFLRRPLRSGTRVAAHLGMSQTEYSQLLAQGYPGSAAWGLSGIAHTQNQRYIHETSEVFS